jgi:hypothetical protein
VVESLPSKNEALTSDPSTTKNKRRRRRGGGQEREGKGRKEGRKERKRNRGSNTSFLSGLLQQIHPTLSLGPGMWERLWQSPFSLLLFLRKSQETCLL